MKIGFFSLFFACVRVFFRACMVCFDFCLFLACFSLVFSSLLSSYVVTLCFCVLSGWVFFCVFFRVFSCFIRFVMFLSMLAYVGIPASS